MCKQVTAISRDRLFRQVISLFCDLVSEYDMALLE